MTRDTRALIATSDTAAAMPLKNALESLGFEIRIASYDFAADARDWKAHIIAVHIPGKAQGGSGAICAASDAGGRPAGPGRPPAADGVIGSFSEVRGVPLIVLLDEDDQEMEIKCLSAGADDCLPASSDYRVLAAHMQALIRRYGLARMVRRQKPLRAGPVVLDPSRWTAESGGRPVKLTPKEFAVLELLMRRKSKIVPRGELMDRIRRSFETSVSHTIETHISNIRSKLGRSCSCRIEAVTGVGYVLSVGHAGRRKM